MAKSVKLKSIVLTDYKGIEKLSADINGSHFIVCGMNGAGKTSVLEVINKSAVRATPAQVADMPIRVGAKNAKTGIVYEIEEDGSRREILVEIVYRPSGSVLKLIDLSNDGELKPPIEKLRKIIGESHDLSSLLDMDGKEQFKELLGILGGSEIAAGYEAEYQDLYEERKRLNKNLKEASTELTLNEPPLEIMQVHRSTGGYSKKIEPETYPKQPDKVDLVVRLNEANTKNERRDRALEKLADVKREIEQLQRELAEKERQLETGDAWLEENPFIDTADLQKEIEEVDVKIEQYQDEMHGIKLYDQMVDRVAAHLVRVEGVKKKEAEINDVQVKMDALQEKMKSAVGSLDLGAIVPELRLMNEVDESGPRPVFRQGIFYVIGDQQLIPFNKKQISYAKALVALAKLSSYVNAGKLNFFHIPAWNELDEASKKELLTFAEENSGLNIQFGIEQVDDKPLGIKIIDKSGTSGIDHTANK